MNPIHIIKSIHLDQKQQLQILQLTKQCREHDGISTSYPLDPEDHAVHFLLYNKTPFQETPILLSALSILSYDEETVECTAFTHPDHRQQGYFSMLLERALEEIGDCDILFPVSGSCPDTAATLSALEAELDSCELQMELELSTDRCPCDAPAVLTVSETDPEEDLTVWCLFENSSLSKCLGSCQTSLISETSVCLHHVEILPEFRGCGYGTIFMKKLITALQEQGIKRILLQVSGDNHAAMALYKKQGFRITEALSFYLY